MWTGSAGLSVADELHFVKPDFSRCTGSSRMINDPEFVEGKCGQGIAIIIIGEQVAVIFPPTAKVQQHMAFPLDGIAIVQELDHQGVLAGCGAVNEKMSGR